MRERIRHLYAAPLLTIMTKAKAKPEPPFSSVPQALEAALKEQEQNLVKNHSTWANKDGVSVFLDYTKERAIIKTVDGFMLPVYINPYPDADSVVDELSSGNLLISPRLWMPPSRLKLSIECAAYLLPSFLRNLKFANKQVPDMVLKLQLASRIVETRLWQEFLKDSLDASFSFLSDGSDKPDESFQKLIVRCTGIMPACEKKVFLKTNMKISQLSDFFSQSRLSMMAEIANEDKELFRSEMLRPFEL